MAFKQLKEYLRSLPLLTFSNVGEELIMYLSISPTVVSVMLIKKDDKVQKPMYYISKVFIGVEIRSLKIERLAYALVIATRKLRHYF